MEAYGQQASQLVLRPSNEQMHGVFTFTRLFVLIQTFGSSHQLINEWMKVKVSLNIYNVKPSWRRIWELTVLDGWIARRNKSREQDRQVHHEQNNQPNDDTFSHLQSARTRGSTITSMASARRLPRIMKRVEAITTPTTT